MNVVILSSDYWNGVYEDGILVDEGKPSYLSVETLLRTYKRQGHSVLLYGVDDKLYHQELDGGSYPKDIESFPLDDCEFFGLHEQPRYVVSSGDVMVDLGQIKPCESEILAFKDRCDRRVSAMVQALNRGLYNDYPTEPINDGSPYWRCKYCKVDDVVINGILDKHLESCEYRQIKQLEEQVATLKAQK